MFRTILMLTCVSLCLWQTVAGQAWLPDPSQVRAGLPAKQYAEYRAYIDPTIATHDTVRMLQQTRAFIGMHPDYELSLLLFRNLLQAGPVTRAEERFATFPAGLQGSDLGKEVAALIARQTIQPGQTAQDFTAQTPDGHSIHLSDLRGKYVLVDFWASWCHPCRMENPNLLQAWQHYKDRGLQIVSFSMDENKDAWLKAVKEDQLPWTQVSDGHGFKSDIARTWQILYIPRNFLLDPSGNIVAIDLRGGILENTLIKIFQ